MRRVLIAAIALVVALSCAATARPAATFVIKGKGWGHGLGLAQYGAHGYARDGGRDYRWILDHYYTGTTLGAAGVARVRVLVASGVGRVTVGSAAAFTVTSANGRTFNLSAGTHTIRANLQVRTANGTLRTLVGPLRFDPGTAVLRLSGNGYRGRIRVRAEGGLVSAVNDVGLEQYIKGVVAWEMPASWHPEALKAQAVVARTYGLVSRKTGQWFDLYDDTRSQVYGGIRAEDSRASAAVDATRGEVVRSGGALAWTFYHSTSGGKTASREDEWGPPAHPVPRRRGGRLRRHLAAPRLGVDRRGGRLPQQRPRLRLVGGCAQARSRQPRAQLHHRLRRRRAQRLEPRRADAADRAVGRDDYHGRHAPLRARPALDVVLDRRPAAERSRTHPPGPGEDASRAHPRPGKCQASAEGRLGSVGGHAGGSGQRQRRREAGSDDALPAHVARGDGSGRQGFRDGVVTPALRFGRRGRRPRVRHGHGVVRARPCRSSAASTATHG